MNPSFRSLLCIGAGLAAIAAAAARLLWPGFGAASGGIDLRIHGRALSLPAAASHP